MEHNLSVNYVRVGVVSNLDHTGHVVLIGATSPESLEAAGQFLLAEAATRELIDGFHVKRVDQLPALEFLLEVRGLNSVPESQKMLAMRAKPDTTR